MFRLTWRNFVRALLVAITAAGIVVLAMRTRIQDAQIQAELTLLRAAIGKISTDLRTEHAILNARIESLEREVFGTVPAAAKPVVIDTGPRTWQRNRDAELRKRIEALEQRDEDQRKRLESLEIWRVWRGGLE